MSARARRILAALHLLVAILLTLVLLTGCATAPRVELQRVSVPVPVECREPIPVRPAMPTEALAPGVLPFDLLRAALAEIDRREGYELQLRAALGACTAPITPRRPDGGTTESNP